MTTLAEQGFTEIYTGTWERTIDGDFGFHITVTIRDWDGKPVIPPMVSVSLPHQCDAWDIVDRQTEPLEILSAAARFASEFSETTRVTTSLDLSYYQSVNEENQP